MCNKVIGIHIIKIRFTVVYWRLIECVKSEYPFYFYLFIFFTVTCKIKTFFFRHSGGFKNSNITCCCHTYLSLDAGTLASLMGIMVV